MEEINNTSLDHIKHDYDNTFIEKNFKNMYFVKKDTFSQ